MPDVTPEDYPIGHTPEDDPRHLAAHRQWARINDNMIVIHAAAAAAAPKRWADWFNEFARSAIDVPNTPDDDADAIIRQSIAVMEKLQEFVDAGNVLRGMAEQNQADDFERAIRTMVEHHEVSRGHKRENAHKVRVHHPNCIIEDRNHSGSCARLA